MHEWIKTQLATGLPGFVGSTISGTVVVKQELVNDVLAEAIRATRSGAPAATTPLDLSVLTKFVEEASVRADVGTLSLDFKIGV